MGYSQRIMNSPMPIVYPVAPLFKKMKKTLDKEIKFKYTNNSKMRELSF